MAQLSTSISDFVLAMSSFYASIKAYKSCQTYAPSAGFLCMGIAASIGTIRFAMKTPNNKVLFSHKTASNISKGISISLIASGYYEYYGTKALLPFYALSICSLIFDSEIVEKISSISTVLAMFATVLHAGSHSNDESVRDYLTIMSVSNLHYQAAFLACGGAVALIFFGLVIGTEGKIGPFKKVDIFHYGIAAANLMLAQSLEWWCYH
eukprot:319426_1